MNKKFLKVALFASLMSISFAYTSCSKEDDSPAQNNQEVTGGTTDKPSDEKTDDVVLVSELKCTVAEFATKYTTLKKGEKVNVTLTDVSDANISKVAQTLQKMSATTISKAASDDNYIVVLVLESKDELTKIPAEVFKDCKAIVSVTIPECVELIESGAFDGCSALEAVKILSEVAVIQEGAFAENVKVEKGDNEVVKPEIKLLSPADIVAYVNASDEEIVTLNMALETYDHTEVMVEIAKITDKKVKLVIPEGVDVLGMDDDKFPKDEIYGRIYPKPSALVSVGIPESVTEIGNRAFYSCDGLISITIPSSCKSIGEFAFQSCKGLTSISIPSSCKSIGNFAFNGCFGLEDLTISNGVEKIGLNSFAFCYRIKNVIIPESVTEIGEHAFHGCEGITDIIIPEGVDMISYGAFQGCSKLVSVTINSDFTKINSDAFFCCDNLQTIYCSQAIYDKYHKTFPQMVVKGGNSTGEVEGPTTEDSSVSGNIDIDDLEEGKNIN